MNKYDYELKRQRWETVDVVAARLSKWGPICVICYFGYLSIAALAGKATLATFGLWLIADVKINKVFSHAITTAFGVGGITYGYRERKLKRKTIERLSAQVIERERELDPKRSSSRLTTRGATRPEDTI
jgi:hypothetical protein